MEDQNKKESPSNKLNSGRDVTIGGDVSGRDKVNTTTTNTLTVSEGGLVARYAIVGLSVISALALIVSAIIASSATAPPFLSVSPSLTLTPPPTLTPSPPPTPSPTASPSATFTPRPSITPTLAPPTPSPTATATLPPGLTPVLASTLPVYDDFNDQCLNASRWVLAAEPRGSTTSTPPPIQTADGCLQVERQLFSEDANGRLNVFASVEAARTHRLVEAGGACYRETEVALTLDQVEVFAERHEGYLLVGLTFNRATGPSALEVRVRGSNINGPLRYEIIPRLIVPSGHLDFSPTLFIPGQPLRLAFRTRPISSDAASANNRLTLFVNEQPLRTVSADGRSIPLQFSILADPCNLTLGYHVDEQTLLDGHFDEVRFGPSP